MDSPPGCEYINVDDGQALKLNNLAGTSSRATVKPSNHRNSRIVCCLLVLSTLTNFGLAGFLIWLFNNSTGAEPIPPPAPAPVNRSCPFSGNRSTGDGEIRLAAFRVSSNTVDFCWPEYVHPVRDMAPYELRIDDWFTNRTELRSVYAGSKRSFRVTGLLPSQILTAQLVVHHHLTPTGATSVSEKVQVQLLEAKYCGNPQDLSIIKHAATNHMSSKLKSCDMSPGDAVKCIEEKLGMTPDCSQCFASEKKCIIRTCVAKAPYPCLLDGSGPACKKCMQEHCMPAVATCGSIPLWALNVTAAGVPPS